MEKLYYALWAPADQRTFNNELLGPVRDRLQELGADRLKFNIVDDAVETGAALRQDNIKPPISAVVSFWLNTAHVRAPFEAVLYEAALRIAGYTVTESVPIPNVEHVSTDGERTAGFNQIAFLTKPPRLTYGGWLEHWMGRHTKVAVETQSTFYYCQNIVQRRLTHGAPDWNGIVEECFPADAMTDQEVFFDAVGDKQRFETNLQRMMDSCYAFIDFDKIDVILASEYRVGAWRDLQRPNEIGL